MHAYNIIRNIHILFILYCMDAQIKDKKWKRGRDEEG